MDYIFGLELVNHNQVEIFNGTKVQNLYDNRVWQLANTPNTTPPIFSWEPALILGEAQRNFLQYPVQTNEIADNSVTDAKLGNRTLTDNTASSSLPGTGAVTTILQAIRNCLKWLTAQFDTATGHSHNGTDSRKISYNNLTDTPTNYVPNSRTLAGLDLTANRTAEEIKTALSITGGLSQGQVEFLSFLEGSISVTTLSSIPVTYQTVVATISSYQSFSVVKGLAQGRTIQVFVQNTSSNSIQITIPNTGDYISMSETTKTIRSYGWMEIHITSINGKYNIRVGEQE
jgi:hypothetical protein